MSQPVVSATGADWRRAVEPFVGPNARRASFQLVTTLVPFALLVVAIHFALQWSVLLALLFAVPTAGLIVRTFIFMHDCAHGSFFESRVVNDTVGFITGVLTLTPYSKWRREHALHHASSGDLDRRGHGDVTTLTVREYLARSPRERLAYRIERHPLTLLLGGPLYMAFWQRWQGDPSSPRGRKRSGVQATNAAIVLLLAIALFTVGWKTVVFAYALPYYLAAMAGVWLFYVQHQFEDAYWSDHGEWDYAEASLRGSSHLRLPALLQWFTGNIGLHHVHHIAPKIPNYMLQPCNDSSEIFQRSPVVTLRSGMTALRLALWDEDQKRLVRFRDVVQK